MDICMIRYSFHLRTANSLHITLRGPPMDYVWQVWPSDLIRISVGLSIKQWFVYRRSNSLDNYMNDQRTSHIYQTTFVLGSTIPLVEKYYNSLSFMFVICQYFFILKSHGNVHMLNQEYTNSYPCSTPPCSWRFAVSHCGFIKWG